MTIEIITLNKTEKVETVCIKKGVKYRYFKGEKMTCLLRIINNQDIKLKQFVNSLR